MDFPHYKDARMQHFQSRLPALPGVTTAVAPRGVPASTNEVFPASPTYEKKRPNTYQKYRAAMHFTIIDTRADVVDNIDIVAHAWIDGQKSVKFHNKIHI